MENMTKTFPQQVREKYGESVHQFAERVGVRDFTVKAWEQGSSRPNGSSLAMLNALSAHKLKACAKSAYKHLDTPQDVKTLTRRIIDGFGDSVASFARRIGVHRNNVERWLYDGHISRSGKALLLAVAKQPELFMQQPKQPQPMI